MESSSRLEEPFIINAMVSLALATVWLFLKRAYLLEYFYFSQLLGITHLFTLGFLSSLMMGVLYRLGPTLLGAPPKSRLFGRVQFFLYVIGVWGMVSHFWLDESRGMSWSTFLVWAASLVQLANFRGLFSVVGRNRWPARFVAASLVYFTLAATVGVLLGLVKGYGVGVWFLSPNYIDNVFAHAHLAGLGWVTMMIMGVQLKLVPTTASSSSTLPLRFALMQLGTLGLAAAFVFDLDPTPYAFLLAAAFVLHAWGPFRAWMSGRVREWELLPLGFLMAAAGVGIALGLDWPAPDDPLRGRLQLVYGFVAIVGFMVLTVLTVAFKLFPMWVWKERFQADFGKKPVPGMKELHSEKLRVFSNLSVAFGVALTAAAVLTGAPSLLSVGTALVLLGTLAFVTNFVRVARWGLLKLDYSPTPADIAKFEEIFPHARGE